MGFAGVLWRLSKLVFFLLEVVEGFVYPVWELGFWRV